MTFVKLWGVIKSQELLPVHPITLLVLLVVLLTNEKALEIVETGLGHHNSVGSVLCSGCFCLFVLQFFCPHKKFH